MVLRCTVAGLLVFCGITCAQTWLAEVTAVDRTAGQVTVDYLRSPIERPATLRTTAGTSEGLREGAIIRLNLDQYFDEWWLDSWWPVSSAAADVLVGERWWQRSEDAPKSFPASGVLGLDDQGEIVNLTDESFQQGFIVVPCSRSSSGAVPEVIEMMRQFSERLSTTPHRDLPVVMWSLEPDRDTVSEVEKWRSSGGEYLKNFIWVTSLQETRGSWLDRLSVVLFEVEGQDLETNPMVVAFADKGIEIMRYEGHSWPIESLVLKLDDYLLGTSRSYVR